MNIQKLVTFIKAVECGNITKAAKLLNYSQSGVSRAIKDIEDEWGFTLFERCKNGVRLTSEGVALMPYICAVTTEFNILMQKIEEIKGLESGFIRIGTFTSVAVHRLPRIIEQFKKDFPNVVFEILTGEYLEVEDWLINGRVDCGFVRLPVSKRLETTVLEEDLLLAVMPYNHELANLDCIPLNTICLEPFMLIERDVDAEVTELFEEYNLKPNIKFISWDDYVIMAMIERGLGVSIIPSMFLETLPLNLITRPLSEKAHRTIGYAVRNRGTTTYPVKQFEKYLHHWNHTN